MDKKANIQGHAIQLRQQIIVANSEQEKKPIILNTISQTEQLSQTKQDRIIAYKMPQPKYPPQLYPHSKSQLQQILTDYYSLTLQLQTLQRHILKIQTQNQQKHKLYTDQVQKLKLYIDQCENEIKKRQQRELLLIQRLKELENSGSQQIEDLRLSPNHYRSDPPIFEDFDIIIRQKQDQWNNDRQKLITENQTVLRHNSLLTSNISHLQITIKQLRNHNSTLHTQHQQLQSQIRSLQSKIRSFQSQILELTQSLHSAYQNIQKLQQSNHQLHTQIQQFNASKEDTLKQLSQKQQVLPISSSCLNCLKITKMHELQMEKKSKHIDSLKKDVQSLLAFFDLAE